MSPSGSSRSAAIAARAASADPSDGQSARKLAASLSNSGGSGSHPGSRLPTSRPATNSRLPTPDSRLTSERLEEPGKRLRIAVRAQEGQAEPVGAEQLPRQLLHLLGGDGVDLRHHLFRS